MARLPPDAPIGTRVARSSPGHPMLGRRITVISRDRATRKGVEAYFQRAGARPSSVVRLADVPPLAEGADAIVLFADDYPRRDAVAVFAKIRRALPRTLLIVVTDAEDAFLTSPAGDDRVVVLRRPAWIWMLADVVRASGWPI
jgi:hypothetical protein